MGRILDYFNHRFNYTDLHELNLDWLISEVKELIYQVDNFVSLNTIKYADPIQWNITTQYETNTVVIDANDGTAYLSVAPVPSGVALTNTDYWTPIFTLNLLSANQNITLRNDGSNVYATFSSNTGDWLIWNNVLYKVTQTINISESYVIGYNLTRYTVEMFIEDYIADIKTSIGDLDDLTTTDKSNLVSAINEVLTTLNNTTGDLDNLTTTDKSNLVSAINELALNKELFVSVKDYGAVGDGVTDDSAAIQDCIDNEQYIYIPDGTYIVKNIELKSHRTIIGTKNAILELAHGLTSDDALGTVSSGLFSFDYATILWADDKSDIRLYGFTLNGSSNDRSGEFIQANNLWAYKCSDIHIDNMDITDALNDNVQIYDSSFLYVTNNHISYSGQAIEKYPLETNIPGDTLLFHYHCRNIECHNNIIDHSHSVGIEFEGRGITNNFDSSDGISIVNISNCIVRDSRAHGFMMYNCYDLTITNCSDIVSSGFNGFSMIGGNRITMSNCVSRAAAVFGLSIGDESNQGAVGYQSPTNVLVDNFIVSGSEGIQIRNCTNINLNNILVYASDADNYQDACVWVYGGTNTQIRNADLRCVNTYAPYGIKINGSNRTVITNCNVQGISGGSGVYAISSGRTIIDGLYNRNNNEGVLLSGTHTNTVLNNVIEDATTTDITTLYGSDSDVTINAAVVI